MSPGQLAGPYTRQIPLLAWLVLVWILFWGTWSWANVISGIVVALLVTWLLPLPPVVEHARLRPVAALAFLAHFAADLAISSAQIAWAAIRPGGPPRAAVIQVELETDSDLLLTLISETLTLVPGSIVLDVDRANRVLLMHVMPVRDEADVDRERARVLQVEERVVKAFGSSREIAALAGRAERGTGGAGR